MVETINKLNRVSRQLLQTYGREPSTEEIAEHTGIPKTSVAVMISTARKKVMTELKRRMKL